MKSLMLFLQSVLQDLEDWCSTSTTRDLKTIASRVEDEGLSFLTITLANFGKDFQKSLDQGFVGHDQFLGFSRTGGLPRFLGGFLDRVFDRKSGRLLDEPDVVAIWAVRQLTLMFAKINLPCTPAREAAAISEYVECEKDVRVSDRRVSSDMLSHFARTADHVFGEVFRSVNMLVDAGDIIPKHGPGQTADRLVGNAKWDLSVWHGRLEDGLSIDRALIPSWRHFEHLQRVNILEPGAEIPVKIVSVPKTQKTPRIIAMEPTCMMFVQQGLKDAITESIERDDILSSIVGWMDQTPNQRLAKHGSLHGHLATLDLSEASDRVSNQLVRALLTFHPQLAAAVDGSRSRKADVPGHGVIRLAKFASMGSALTFPIESMVFTTIVFMAIGTKLNRPVTRKLVEQFSGSVRIYGDDIVVPTEFVHSVVTLLTAFGLKVNVNKSFWTGKFRESCGKDYYDGHDVSVARVRSMIPTRRTDVGEIIASVSLRNQLYKLGMWKSARHLDNVLGRLIPFPTVTEESPALGRHSFLGYETQRMCPNLHRPLVKAMVVRAKSPANAVDGVSALLKWFSIRGDQPIADENHLQRSGRPRAVSITPRWTTPY